jgi:hypothetical protein
MIMRWNGSAWSLARSPQPGQHFDKFFGVWCVTARFCMAVGQQASRPGAGLDMAARWTGSSWVLS